MSAPPAPSDGAEDVRAGNVAAGVDPPAREVVVGVDGSEVGLSAARWAAQEAARRDAPLRILHAATYLGRPESAGAPPPELPRARRITAQAYTVARHAAPGVQSATEVVPADPVAALLEAASDAQLLVLGSSTTGAADEMVLASVAVRVAARSPQPVVVVPRQRTEAEGRPAVAVLGVGDAADDEAVAQYAAEAAERAGVPLSVLQTRSGRRATASWVDDSEEWSRRFPGLEVTISELPAARADHVLRATCPSPMLVISAGHHGFLHRSLDGPHRWLLRHCTSPMTLLPPVDRSHREPREEVAPT